MAIVVVGGHTRNIGKTSVVAGLIAAMPERQWTAMKITQFGHGVCSANGEPCDCDTADHALAVTEERNRESGTDTARFLAAGAARSFWVRTRQGELHEAMPRLRRLFAAAGNVIVESNSLLRFLQPAVYLSVVDPRVPDFKPSSIRYLDRADALLVPAEAGALTAWPEIAASLLASVPHLAFRAPVYCTPELARFVADRLDCSALKLRAS